MKLISPQMGSCVRTDKINFQDLSPDTVLAIKDNEGVTLIIVKEQVDLIKRNAFIIWPSGFGETYTIDNIAISGRNFSLTGKEPDPPCGKIKFNEVTELGIFPTDIESSLEAAGLPPMKEIPLFRLPKNARQLERLKAESVKEGLALGVVSRYSFFYVLLFCKMVSDKILEVREFCKSGNTNKVISQDLFFLTSEYFGSSKERETSSPIYLYHSSKSFHDYSILDVRSMFSIT